MALPRHEERKTVLVMAFFDSGFQRDGQRWQLLRDAKPASRQHFPLNAPSTLGEYDLTRPEQVAPVVAMARQAGIDGFVLDCVWRDGAYRHDGALLAPFCGDGFGLALTWRNGLEPIWQDAAAIVEMERRANALIDSLRDFPAQMLAGGVTLIVDRPKHLAAIAAVTALLRRAARSIGLPGLTLIANHPEDKGRFLDNGFDFLLDPAPDQWHSCSPANSASGLDFLEVIAGLKDSSDYLDRFFPYLSFVVGRSVNRASRGRALPRVFPAFHDWLSHDKGGATQLTNGSRPCDPAWYGMFVENAMLYVDAHFPPGQQALFLQSWNGWLDGSQIEPSLLDGDLLFNATRDAIDRGRYMAASRAVGRGRSDPRRAAAIAQICRDTRALVIKPTRTA